MSWLKTDIAGFISNFRMSVIEMLFLWIIYHCVRVVNICCMIGHASPEQSYLKKKLLAMLIYLLNLKQPIYFKRNYVWTGFFFWFINSTEKYFIYFIFLLLSILFWWNYHIMSITVDIKKIYDSKNVRYSLKKYKTPSVQDAHSAFPWRY